MLRTKLFNLGQRFIGGHDVATLAHSVIGCCRIDLAPLVALVKATSIMRWRITRVPHVCQSVPRDIVQEEQEKLEKNLATLVAAAVGLQKKKRLDLDNTLANFAKKAMTTVDNQVRARYLR